MGVGKVEIPEVYAIYGSADFERKFEETMKSHGVNREAVMRPRRIH